MSAQQDIEAALGRAIATVVKVESDLKIILTRPDDQKHGDFSSNIALQLAGRAGKAPRDLAAEIVSLIKTPSVTKAEVAGPGFINFFLDDQARGSFLDDIRSLGKDYGRGERNGLRVQVEYCSANPTGPIHVGTGRNIAYGDALARLLDFAGFEVFKETYINDVGRQVDLYGQSLNARYLQALGHVAELPENGYPGEDLARMAAALVKDHKAELLDKPDDIRRLALELTLEMQEETLNRFGVQFDNWFRQSSLQASGELAAGIQRLTEGGHTFESEGALWFRASAFGVQRDQVLVKSNGETTYLASDVAYLLNKVERGFDVSTYVWGADHHGNFETTMAAARALGLESRIEILLYQLVNFTEGGEPVRMGRRFGNIVTLDELIDEVGVDATRYTLINRSIDSTIDFDFEVVKSTSSENPVYYVQYAHARTRSILRYAAEQSVAPAESGELLKHPSEEALTRKLSEFPEVVMQSAEFRAPFRIATYTYGLAALFSAFYRDCRVLTDDAALSRSRVLLTECTAQVLSNALALLGVSAPERM